jgi:hypothetical protein
VEVNDIDVVRDGSHHRGESPETVPLVLVAASGRVPVDARPIKRGRIVYENDFNVAVPM